MFTDIWRNETVEDGIDYDWDYIVLPKNGIEPSGRLPMSKEKIQSLSEGAPSLSFTPDAGFVNTARMRSHLEWITFVRCHATATATSKITVSDWFKLRDINSDLSKCPLSI